MKKICLILCCVCILTTSFAQQALFSHGPLISPEITSSHTVTFRLLAPSAKKVQITGDFLPAQKVETPMGKVDAPGVADLTKTEQGIWEYTTPSPLSPELYSYSFIVDGLKINDPANVYQIRDVGSITNIFFIDGKQADLYKVNNVPHGSVTRRWYNSPSLNMERRITIYTPPGYETSNKNYPVLYLLHGMGGDEEAWIALGRSAQIMDNLIAQGKATPMIVVMPNGNVSQEAAPGETINNLVPPTFQLPKTMEGSMETSFPDIIRFIDKEYRTIQKKSGRAIAGLSMGGFHSFHISKQYPDMFDYTGLFSAAIIPPKGIQSEIYQNNNEKLKTLFAKKPKVFYIAIGKTDFLYQANQELRKQLDTNDFKYEYVESEGGHIWKNWRIYLTEFAAKIFR